MAHHFELRTANIDFFVGLEGNIGGDTVEIVRSWVSAIRQALMPVHSSTTSQ